MKPPPKTSGKKTKVSNNLIGCALQIEIATASAMPRNDNGREFVQYSRFCHYEGATRDNLKSARDKERATARLLFSSYLVLADFTVDQPE